MKSLLLLMLFSTSLFAQTTEKIGMTYWGYEGRNRTFLSCDYVDYAVENILKNIDATDINVRCSGGIQYNTYSPVSVFGKYVLPVQEQTIQIKSEMGANCYFDTSFIEELIRSSKRITKVSGSTHCFRPDDRYNITLKIK